jgi:UDP-galactopyranose mutase
MITEHLILGAGLAGLSAAYHLKERRCSNWRVLEKSERVGGLCKSLRYGDGFIFDQSIHVIYSSDPYASNLIKKLLNGNIAEKGRESWVYSDGIYTPYPWQVNTYGLPVEVVKECLNGIIQATYGKNGGPGPANFEEWCYTTFGDGFAQHFMIPYNRKLWAIDLKKMTDAWIRDRVMTPALNDVIDGALQRQKKIFGPNAIFWYPEEGGIESLPQGFLPYLDQDKISFNSQVTRVLWKEKKIITEDGREWCYDRLISSLPLHLFIKAMDPALPSHLKAACNRLEYNTVYTLNLAVKRENISPYHWVYFPEEKYLFYRINFPHNFSKNMVPPGWNSITVEVSASRYKQIPKGKILIQRVLDDLKEAKIVTDNDTIEVKSILHLNPAYIVYNHSHREDVNSLRRFLKDNDIFSCGRFGEWEYLNMDHSIMSGKMAVEVMSGKIAVEEILEKELFYSDLNVLKAYLSS